MAAKRFLSESGSDPDQQPEKRTRNRPSWASVVEGVVKMNSFQNLVSTIEPMLRRVVNEEVERGVRQSFLFLTRSPSMRIQALEPSSLKLVFNKKLHLPIFTGSKITDIDGNPLQILLVDTTGCCMAPANLSQPVKIDIVVLDGDFNPEDGDNWTSKDFDGSIVKERTGKRPLLAGEVTNITMRDGLVLTGDVEFTDNSSWIRSRKFRIGVRVAAAGTSHSVRIREAFTEAFVVKDHRGELYKKHHPPMLHDEVWRLEKIGKDGAFHKKLTAAGIKSVQDFLKLSTVDPVRLRKILGNGMSEKMWEVTIKHARECDLGKKLHIFRGHNCVLFLNPVCQVVRAVINGQIYPTCDHTSINRPYIENLVREAYSNWNLLEEIEGLLNEPPLLTQGELVDQSLNHQQAMVKPLQQNVYNPIERANLGYLPCNALTPAAPNDWQIQAAYLSTPGLEPGIGYSISDSSSSDGDLPPSKSFFHVS